MIAFNRLVAIITLFAMAATVVPPLEARNRKGDRFYKQGHEAEVRKQWDEALQLYEQAQSADPADPAYRMAADRARFQSAQAHMDKGLELRSQGRLSEALLEFQTAYGINPATSATEQEVRRTQEMIQREKQREEAGKAVPEERGLTPSQLERKRIDEKISTMLAVPELKPLNPQPINIKMNNQSARVLFETVGKVAGINMLFDPEYAPGKNQSIELTNATLDEALDYLAVVTKSFWKPLSVNTIFVTNDNTTKRRDYEEQVMKIFYLTNPMLPQELQEIVTAVRAVADIQRLFVYNAQNAIIARGEADRIALAEKIIRDLDKPRSEVVVDVLVMRTSSGVTRKLAANIAQGGLNVPLVYNPRQSIRAGIANTTTGSTDTPATTTSTAIPLSNIGKWATSDYALTLPDGLLQAVLNDRSTRVLQSPQLRSVDNQKATLKIGDRQPTATGSFQPGIGGVGINPLVNTQFTFIDVGVNVDITPKVHDNNEISMHVELEISSVRDYIDLGGISQPVISQEKAIHDIRLRDGQVNILAGLTQDQETKTLVGIPGLSSIPVIGKLFSSESLEKSESEMLIALVPHIVRRPDVSEQNLRGVAVGNATVVKLNYGRKPGEAAPQPGQPQTPAPAGPTVTQPQPQPAPAAPGAAVAPTPGPVVPGLTTPRPGGLPQAPPPAPAPEAPKTPAAAAGPARVTFAPSQVEAAVGSTVTLNLLLENAPNLLAAPMQIKFDPKVLRMNDVAKGGLMEGDGVIFTKNIMNDSGEATVSLQRTPRSSPGGPSGTLVTLTFQAVAPGITTVTVPQFTPRNTQAQPILTASPVVMVTVK
ncbi:MAG TPA: cohesin domain-containing protein [Bryobacteraceae bacterium]|nr:cohesin domain-containing protein [Bryobacteraceae bacterium]